ncbi:MAG TPA: GNAT family N-acetyltransferase [Candidatus Binataceae bacterium]|jgi:GNAT superfamily N-acetyltransferase|nr:GNAT family N-acetyltransferase [Candidatus Binataceae bacterium]
MALTIRFAAPADAELILHFIRGLAEYERQPDAVRASAASLRAQMEAADPPFECLIAERDGEPAGFALFFRNYSTWSGRPGLYLEDLFVSEPHRGHGVGKALLKRLAAIALERGWARMEWAVLDWNTAAQGFYRALGAFPKDEWTVWRLDGAALASVARG